MPLGDDDIINSPGGFSSGSGDYDLPQDGGGLANLPVNFSPSLTNLLPASMANSGSSYSAYTGLSSGSGYHTSSGYYLDSLFNSTGFSNITKGLSAAGSSLLSAFVTNPENAQTAEGEAVVNAQVQTLESSQLFGYLLVGLVIFLAFSLIGGKK